MKHIACLLLLLSAITVSSANWNLTVDYVNPTTVRVIYTPDSYKGNAADIPFSLVEDRRDGTVPQAMKSGDMETFATSAGILVNRRGNDLLISAGGNTAVSVPESPEITDGKLTLKMNLTGKGSMYGAGERGLTLSLRGDTLVNYNRPDYGYTGDDRRIKQMGITMPMFVSEDGFAVIFDDFAASTMILGSTETGNSTIQYSTENTSAPLSFLYIAPKENTLQNTVAEAVTAMGRQKMPPLWVLGYITSKYGYRTQAETEGVVDTLRRQGFPVDGIVLDLYWYGKEHDMGSLSWENNQWPDHVKMLSNLRKKGVKLIPISQPYILRNGRGIDNYNFLAENGMLLKDSTGKAPQEVKIWVGEGGMLDVTNPATRKWLREVYRKLTLEGVTGWWGDLGEPEVHPETGIHANGLPSRLYHNRYGNDWSSIIDSLYMEEFPEMRLISLMRGGTIGLQKHSVFPWSGDVSRSWGGMEPQIRIMLNSGMSGLAYMSHDVGGFAVDPSKPVDPELYVRWLQLGIFSPVLRTHAQDKAEPYHYAEQRDIILPLIKERYRWLPYNYTLAAENSATGLPLVRSLKFIDPTAPERTDQYLWGNSVLVAPVLEQGAVRREVYFPAGAEWFDAKNPALVYKGGTTETVDAPLAKLPLFVREGAVIPTADYQMKNTEGYRTDRYTLNVYPLAGNGSYTSSLYEDNLTTPSDGVEGSNLYSITQTRDGKDVTLKIRTDRFEFKKAAKKILTVNLLAVDKPVSITCNGKQIRKFSYNPETKTASFNINFEPGIKDNCSIIKTVY